MHIHLQEIIPLSMGEYVNDLNIKDNLVVDKAVELKGDLKVNGKKSSTYVDKDARYSFINISY